MLRIFTFLLLILVFNDSSEAAESCEQKVVRLEKSVDTGKKYIQILQKAHIESIDEVTRLAIQLDRCEAMNTLPRNNRMNDMLQEDNNMLLQDNNRTLRQIKRELE